MTTHASGINQAVNPSDNDANNNSSSPPTLNHAQIENKFTRWQKKASEQSTEQPERVLPRFVFDPDSTLVCYWTVAVAIATLYNTWTIALRIAFPEIRQEDIHSYLPYIDILCDLLYLLDIFIQFRTAYLQDGIPVFDTCKIRHQYMSQTYFIQDVISVLPSQTILLLLPDAVGYCKYLMCTAGAARLTKLLKFHILYKFYDLAESSTCNPHLIRVLRLFLNLAIIIHWIACLYYLLSEYEGLGSNLWVYTNDTDQQRFSRKYIICMYWSAMTLTTIGNTNPPETDVEYIFTGVIFLTGVFVFATVMGNVADVISSMNANRQEFQARMDHIQMYLTHKKVPASLQLKIKKWAEYTWLRTKATDESRLLNMLPERLRAEVAVHVHLDSLKKVKIFEKCETGFLCELVLKLRSQVFSPGDYVCKVGETGREMFIINHGKVEVIVNNPSTNGPMVVAVLSEGNYFGEISLLRLDEVQNRRTADVRSIGYSELLCLSRKDLMSALVEYPEAKSVLEDQAKKRMKTSLQAQRAYSVDMLLRNSQDHSSMDSGIVKDERSGQDMSEIKAMIEELKNANKAPGRTVWQMITRCEVLQAKLDDKEREIEDSKQRIKELEQLLFSHHNPRYVETTMESYKDCDHTVKNTLRPGLKVTKQYSQDEGRGTSEESGSETRRSIPDVRITEPSSEASSSNGDGVETEDRTIFRNNSLLKTSKLKSIYETVTEDGIDSHCRKLSGQMRRNGDSPAISEGETTREDDRDPDFKLSSQSIWNMHPASDYNFSKETLIDHEILLGNNEHILVSTTFKDEFCLTDSLNFNFPTIPEETEDDLKPISHAYFSKRDTWTGSSTANREDTSTGSDYHSVPKIPRTFSVDNLSTSKIPQVEKCSSASNISEIKHMNSSPVSALRKPLTSNEATDFLRATSMDRRHFDETNSRRNSWNLESEGESEEEGTSS